MASETNSGQFEWRGGRQYFAVIVGNLIMFAHGTITGWLSPALPTLLSDETPLATGPLTSDQLSWIGSVTSLAALAGSCSFGIFTSFVGCKCAMIFLAFPSMSFWLFVYFGTSYYHLYIASICAGFTCGGILTSLILYITEIANDNIRGRLGSFLYLSRNIGILASYIIGAVVDYQYSPCIFIFVQIIYVAIFICFPNTPQYHIQRQEFQKAEASLKYYKNFKGKSIDESVAINKELERLKVLAAQNHTHEKVGLRDFCDRKAMSGIIIGIILGLVTQLTGGFTFIMYAVHIFEKSGSTIDPHVSSIVMAVLQIFGNLCSTQFVESLGRKILMIVSLVGSAAGLSALSLYLYLKQNGYDLISFDWLPMVSLSFVVFIASAGVVSLSGICAAEHLPTKVRTAGLVSFAFFLNFSAFLCTKFFPILMDIIDLYGCLLIFAVSSVLGSLFVLFFVEETAGKSLDVVKSKTSAVSK